jgi:Ca2+/Na+ antiporter
MRRLGLKSRSFNIPTKEQFLKLPEEKQSTYWDLVKEFLVGLTVGTNLLWYLLVRGTLRIISGEMSVLSFKTMLPALVVMILMLIVYLRRMSTLPGKLVRDEE